MTKLELCQRLRVRAGISGSGPSTTLSQTGEYGLLVDLIDTAYEDIQNKYGTWDFLRHTFTFTCGIGVSEYIPSLSANLADWKDNSFRCYLATTTDEQELAQLDWETFRDIRLLGTSRNATGRPSEITIKPEKAVVVWPIPDAAYIITGEYYRKADTMTADADTPVFESYQMSIVYAALMQYAGDVGLPTLYATAQKEYKKLIRMMQREYLPRIKLGDPLA
jgi:hypothetical protein